MSLVTVMSGELRRRARRRSYRRGFFLESCERMICPRISQAQQISSGINERWIDDLILFFFSNYDDLIIAQVALLQIPVLSV